jgi:hypothetical protein
MARNLYFLPLTQWDRKHHMIRFALIALALLFATSAEARQRHHAPMLDPGCNVIFPCTPMEGQRVMGMGLFDGIRSINITMHRERRRAKSIVHEISSFGAPSPSIDYTARRVATTIVEHPAGCPRSAFCGCGAAVRVFGTPVRALWLASNWFKFPRAAPAPGMAAVRSHHVFVLEQHLSGDTWLAYDANSGGHQTRLHARSIAGYAIVNPHGAG